MAKLFFKDLKTDNKIIIELIEAIEDQKPKLVDAIVWLQGDRYHRAAKVLSLFKQGWSKKIIIIGNNKLIGPKPKRGQNNISLKKMQEWLEKRRISKRDIIIDDGSFNTLDQAKNVISLAKKNNWQSIILVASRYHQVRAFLTFLRVKKILRWKGKLINQPTKDSWLKIPGGRTKNQKELFLAEIKKIKKYRKDVESVEKGIIYLKNNEQN
jgi:uncharacterized SAM-binding protein YcdF (DUF218 family)